MAISFEAQQEIERRFALRGGPAQTLEESRAAWTAEASAEPLPDGTRVEPVDLGGVASELVTFPGAGSAGTFLLLHGGGYRSGNCITHRKMAAHISAATDMRVYVPDYRLAPEHPFPAAVDDALAAYHALLEGGAEASKLVVGGDSAGGGLSAALLLALRDAAAPLPVCGILLSPWTDILARGASYDRLCAADPAIDPVGLREAGRQYTGSNDPEHPLISPIGADLAGLPPLLIHVGEIETMLDDSTIFAQLASDAGVDVTLEVWPGLWHVWHGSVPNVPEAVAAIEGIGSYVRARLAGSD